MTSNTHTYPTDNVCSILITEQNQNHHPDINSIIAQQMMNFIHNESKQETPYCNNNIVILEDKIDVLDIVEEEEPIIVNDLEKVTTSHHYDDLKKQNIQTLKLLAMSKGLSPDPSKLKKNELLKLLSKI